MRLRWRVRIERECYATGFISSLLSPSKRRISCFVAQEFSCIPPFPVSLRRKASCRKSSSVEGLTVQNLAQVLCSQVLNRTGRWGLYLNYDEGAKRAYLQGFVPKQWQEYRVSVMSRNLVRYRYRMKLIWELHVPSLLWAFYLSWQRRDRSYILPCLDIKWSFLSLWRTSCSAQLTKTGL